MKYGVFSLALAAVAALSTPAFADGVERGRINMDSLAREAPPPATPPTAPQKGAAVAPKNEPAAAETAVAQGGLGQTGRIPLADGALILNVPKGFFFLPASEAMAHLRRINAATPAGNVLGILAPDGSRPTDEGFWGAVVSYNPTGYVAPERADRFRAPDFLQEVRDARTGNQPKPDSFVLLPGFDPTRSGAGWAEQVAAPANATANARTLRYEQRLLGRQGVAGMTIDARADQLAGVSAAAPAMFAMMSFAPGKAYSDYAPGKDPAPQFDLPSLLTNKPRAATPAPSATVAGSGDVKGGGFTPPPATTDATNASVEPAGAEQAPNAFMALVRQPWFPFLGIGLVVLAIAPWLLGRRRRAEEAPIVEEAEVVEAEIVEEKPRTKGIDPNIMPGKN